MIKPLSTKGYFFDLRAFCLYLRNPEIGQVTVEDVIEYFKGMEELGWEKNTFSRKSMALRKFFQFLRKMEIKALDYELIPVIQGEYKPQRVIDEPNYQKLLALFNNEHDTRHLRNRAMLNMLWDTGVRNTELLTLKVSDIDLENMKAVIKTEKAKNKTPFREIFWTRSTNENLRKWLKVRSQVTRDRKTDALFVSFINSTGYMNNSSFGLLLRRLCAQADIPVFNPHSFRHHMGHHIVKQGGSNSDVSNILGHSSLESSYVYTKMNNKELQNRYKHFMGD